MSAQHQNPFERFIKEPLAGLIGFLLYKPEYLKPTGWERKPPTQSEPETEPPSVQSPSVGSPIFGGQRWQGPPLSWAQQYGQTSGQLPPVRFPKPNHLTPQQRIELIEKIDTQRELPKSHLQRVGLLPGTAEIAERARQSQALKQAHLEPIPESEASEPPMWINDAQSIGQQPTIYYWQEVEQLAENAKSEGETPTLEVPAYMKQKVEKRKESE